MPASADFYAPLNDAGLNLHAVFEVDALPATLQAALPDAGHRQLILIGHRGPDFWHALQRTGTRGEHPMDDFSRDVVARWLAGLTDLAQVHWLYPGETAVGLQALGALAGWHHESPFKVGVHPHWGSWFAYRAAVLADTGLPVTPRPDAMVGPCDTCVSKPCVSACPARAMDKGAFSLAACLNHRTAPDSSCADTCRARLACPVGTASRYPADQIRHMYRASLTMIRAYRRESAKS